MRIGRFDVDEQENTTTTGRTQARRRKAKRYGGFGRVSSVGDRGDRLRSPELQETAIRRFADDEGVEVDEVVIELDSKGNKTDTSEGLERLIRRVEAGELDGIIVPKLDRLSRLKARQRIDLVERIGNERLLSATESNDVSTPEGRFVRELFFSFARMEWEQKAEGFETAKRNAIAAGVSVARRPAFGLRFDEAHRYVRGTELEVATLLELFELRAGGASFGDVAARFEERTGRTTAPSTMSELLANRVYLGELRHGELVNLEAHEAVVPLELFEAAAAVSAARSVEHGWSGRRSTLLGGIAKCASCGAGLTRSTSNGGRSVVYRCPTSSRKCAARASIGLDVLEAYVIAGVLEWAGPVVDVVVELELELAPVGDRIVAEHRLEEARRVLVAWAEDVEQELEDGVAYSRGLKAREQLVAKRERELVELGEATEVEVARSTVRAALDGEGFELEERRRLLSVVLDEVVVRKTPVAGAAVAERAELIFATSTARALGKDATELLEEPVAGAAA